MATRPTQIDDATTALDLLERFADSPTYRALAVQQQCHIQEAIAHLSEYESESPTTRPSEVDVPGVEELQPELRAAKSGEFTTDVDVN